MQEAAGSADVDEEAARQFEAVERWYTYDWMAIDVKLRTSIVEGISVFLSLFDDNPTMHRIFCPPKETYDEAVNQPDADGKYPYGRPMPSFAWLIEEGKVLGLNFPVSLNPGLARAIGTLMKMDFQRSVLLRIPAMVKHTDRYFRQVVFVCDEYQKICNARGPIRTALSRRPKCIPIVATLSLPRAGRQLVERQGTRPTKV